MQFRGLAISVSNDDPSFRAWTIGRCLLLISVSNILKPTSVSILVYKRAATGCLPATVRDCNPVRGQMSTHCNRALINVRTVVADSAPICWTTGAGVHFRTAICAQSAGPPLAL